MIKFKLKELIAKKEFKENKKITLEQIGAEIAVHRTTLSKIANNKKGYNATTDVLDKLCEYFCVELSELAQYIKNSPEKSEAKTDNVPQK
jgi:putative transcriptional regulator